MKLGMHVVNDSVDLPQNDRGPIITPPSCHGQDTGKHLADSDAKCTEVWHIPHRESSVGHA